MKKSVLLLNQSEEILNVISWQKAVRLIFADKVSTPHNYDEYHEISVSNNTTYKLPKAIMVKEYVKIAHRSAALNRRNLMRRDNFSCQYCSVKLDRDTETIDHIIPQSKGGKNSWKNVVACCKSCNVKKADGTPEQVGLKLIRQPFVPSHHNLIMNMASNMFDPSWERWLAKR